MRNHLRVSGPHHIGFLFFPAYVSLDSYLFSTSISFSMLASHVDDLDAATFVRGLLRLWLRAGWTPGATFVGSGGGKPLFFSGPHLRQVARCFVPPLDFTSIPGSFSRQRRLFGQCFNSYNVARWQDCIYSDGQTDHRFIFGQRPFIMCMGRCPGDFTLTCLAPYLHMAPMSHYRRFDTVLCVDICFVNVPSRVLRQPPRGRLFSRSDRTC